MLRLRALSAGFRAPARTGLGAVLQLSVVADRPLRASAAGVSPKETRRRRSSPAGAWGEGRRVSSRRVLRLSAGMQDLLWTTVASRLDREFGEPVVDVFRLAPARPSRATWAARTASLGHVVVKVRHGDWAYEKTEWCAEHLPRLAARGYPVPRIVWHGVLDDDWHAVVQDRLPGEPLRLLTPSLLRAALELIELQAEACVPAHERDFADYVAKVLFDGWDYVWRDAERASPAARELCARLRRWLAPVWGQRLPARDYANNDMNLSNILSDGAKITGVVDWDEFGLGSRAIDLVAIAFDCERTNDHGSAKILLEQAGSIAGRDGLRHLVSYRSIALLAARARTRRSLAIEPAVTLINRIVDSIADA